MRTKPIIFALQNKGNSTKSSCPVELSKHQDNGPSEDRGDWPIQDSVAEAHSCLSRGEKRKLDGMGWLRWRNDRDE